MPSPSALFSGPFPGGRNGSLREDDPGKAAAGKVRYGQRFPVLRTGKSMQWAFAPVKKTYLFYVVAMLGKNKPHRMIEFHPGRVHGQDKLPGGYEGVLVVFRYPRRLKV